MLALALGAGVCLVGGPVGAEVEHLDAGPVAGEEQCVVGYASDGRAAVIGTQLEVPYPNFSGGPYVATQIDSLPKARALASEAYEGFAGEVVLGTSGFYPPNPTTAAAYHPAVEGGKSEDVKESPLTRSVAQTGEGKSTAWAGAFGRKLADNVSIGPSVAQSQVGINGKVLKGTDEVWGYEFRIGDAVIDNLHSVIDYESDGTEAGAKGTWKLEFGQIRSSGGGGSMTGDGIVLQGGAPTPGPSGREQFNAGAKQLADALQQAGVGRVEVTVQPGKVETRGSEVVINGAGLVIRAEPTPTSGSTVHAFAVIFGRNDRSAKIDLGTCAGEISTPAIAETVTGPSGPPSDGGPLPVAGPAESENSSATDAPALSAGVGSGFRADSAAVETTTPAGEPAAPAAEVAAASPGVPRQAAAPVRLAGSGRGAVERGYTWFAWLAVVGLVALFGLGGLQALALTRRP
jgi:hypothetical protein